MKRAKNLISMYEITKIMFEGKSDFEKQLEYQKWLKNKDQIEDQIMNDINKSIEKKLIDLNKENTERMKKFGILKEEKNQMKKNFIDLPLSIDKNFEGKIVERAEIGSEGYAENIEYQLMVAVDSNTGKMSIQYYGEDDTYLSHKEIIKAIKIENKIGKHGNK